VLLGGLATLVRIAGPQRVIAGLGTGDRLSAAENLSYGLTFPPKEERYALLEEIALALRCDSIPVWVGGRSPRARLAAARVADALNAWNATPSELAAEHAEVVGLANGLPRQVPPGVTWGGQVLIGRDATRAAELLSRYGTRPGLIHGDVAVVAEHFRDLARAGASWVVCSPLDVVADPHGAVETLTAVAEALG
jgi:alkanesulfonate monooxygenase SsuD/methylene tetrahydromethanopterin reductase-like flavin-dependent oxidoreductase (luciferase family)